MEGKMIILRSRQKKDFAKKILIGYLITMFANIYIYMSMAYCNKCTRVAFRSHCVRTQY